MSLTKVIDLPKIPGGAATQQENFSQVVSGGQSFPVFTNDLIRVDILNLVAEASFQFSAIIRRWKRNGGYELVPVQKTFPNMGAAITSDGTLNRFEFGATDGDIISAMIQPASATVHQYGDTFVRCSIVRGGPNDGSRFSTFVLFQDYVTTFGALAFPQSQISVGPNRAGSLQTVAFSPAVGADVNFAVPANQLWLLTGMELTFTASAAVANRVPRLLVLDNNANPLRQYRSSQQIAASTSVLFLMQPGQNTSDAAAGSLDGSLFSLQLDAIAQNVFRADFQAVYMRENYTIQTITAAMDVADAYTLCEAHIQRWVLPAANTL